MLHYNTGFTGCLHTLRGGTINKQIPLLLIVGGKYEIIQVYQDHPQR